MTENISVHTRKYYRVILEEVDRAQETEESFAIKLSMRMRTTLPRVRQVLRNLPYTIKSGLSASQANGLKGVLEEIGGRARLESHFVTPGVREEPSKLQPEANPEPVPEPEVVIDKRVCPSCGWEEEPDSKHCTLCLRRFRDDSNRPKSLGSRIPHENPIHAQPFRAPDEIAEPKPASVWERHKLALVIGGVAAALLILWIIK